jgi:hypothetical protein
MRKERKKNVKENFGREDGDLFHGGDLGCFYVCLFGLFLVHLEPKNIPLNLSGLLLKIPHVTHLLKEPENWSIRVLK